MPSEPAETQDPARSVASSPPDEPERKPRQSIVVLVTAAGASSRFGGEKKEFLTLGGRSVLDRAIEPFLALEGLVKLAITAPPGREEELRSTLAIDTVTKLGDRLTIAAGGPTRRDSVRLGLEALALACTGEADEVLVLVHDGARPWASADLVRRVALLAAEKGACVPVLPQVDTPKELGSGGEVLSHPKRSAFGGAQTPQGFRLAPLLEAHRRAFAENADCTDDAELYDRYIGKVAWLPGEAGNRKITFREDLPAAAAGDQAAARCAKSVRIGEGWDVHRLAEGRRLVLGGVVVPFDRGEEAHSDGDVLLHAVIDALLGAAALGDIGTHFPPSDPKWRGADSRDLARRVAALVREAGWEPGNVDCTVVLERPRLGPWRDAMRESIAACLGIEAPAVAVKAKTAEGLGAVGEGLAVEARAVVTLFPRR